MRKHQDDLQGFDPGIWAQIGVGKISLRWGELKAATLERHSRDHPLHSVISLPFRCLEVNRGAAQGSAVCLCAQMSARRKGRRRPGNQLSLFLRMRNLELPILIRA